MSFDLMNVSLLSSMFVLVSSMISSRCCTLSNLCSPWVKEFSPIILMMLLVQISWSHTLDATLLVLSSLPVAPNSNGISRGISSDSPPAAPDEFSDAFSDAPRLGLDAFLLGSDGPPAGVDLPSPPPGADGCLGLLNRSLIVLIHCSRVYGSVAELLNLVLVDLVGDIILVILGLQEKDYSNK